ncbi:MAG: (2Fe-2S)-binding protein [Acidobacteria bacterium]|nr:(2Fe-2S)-binding protein [Acidobacteriota bacterium]
MTVNGVAVAFSVNGVAHRLEVGPGETLLRTLRERLRLTGTKDGCVEGECGACTVLVDDRPVDSCILLTAALEGRQVRTVEGLSGDGALGPLQQAFIDHGSVQCGFCTPGFLMTLTALLEENPSPSSFEVREALDGNICRCTGYRQIIEAVAAVTAESTRP